MQHIKETVLLIIVVISAVAVLSAWFTGSLDGDLNQLTMTIDGNTKINVFGNGNANIAGTIQNNSPVSVNIIGVTLFDGTNQSDLNTSIVTNSTIAPYGSSSIKGVLQDTSNNNISLTSGQEVDVIFEFKDDDGKTDIASITLRTR